MRKVFLTDLGNGFEVITRDRPYDPKLPNHFADDGLGHPDRCTDRHNHPARQAGRIEHKLRHWLWRAFRPGSVGQGIVAISVLFVIAVIVLGLAWAFTIILTA